MSLFKKRKNTNVRQIRLGDDEGEGSSEEKDQIISASDKNIPKQVDSLGNATRNGANVPTNDTVAIKKPKKKQKDKPEKKPAVLSFEDDLEADDGIVFQEKKSSLSYKLRKEMKREKKEKDGKGKSKLIDGKEKNGDKRNPSSVSELVDLGIKIVNGREAEAIGALPGDSDEDTPISQHIFCPRKKIEEVSLINPWKDALQGGKIPDANLIHQIRKQRQKARQDFIPIDDTVRLEENKGRLIREDENDHSDEDESRIGFSVNHEEADRKLRREAFEAVQAEAGDCEQDMDWELQQLKKAGAAATLRTSEPEMNQDTYTDMSTTSYYGNGYGVNPPVYPPTVEPSYGSLKSMIPTSSSALPRPSNYQAEGIIKRLRDSRESLHEVYRRHRIEADGIIDELVTSKTTIVHCNVNTQPHTETFQFYQDMRGYVTDLRECLNEKLGEIQKLEDQVGLSYRQRKQKIIHRRRQDVKDQNSEFSPFAVGKQSKQDEYRIRRAAEREGRRTRRRREREKKCNTTHHDGVSTDDEEANSEMQLRKGEFLSLKSDGAKVMLDVEDEFSLLKSVMLHFENWKKIDLPSYSDAYVSYNLPKIAGPYIRLELAFWNPLLNDDAMEIERLNWFNTLIMYGSSVSIEGNLGAYKEDCDRRLMSNLVEKVVLPKLKDLVCCSWDPLSHVQSVRLVNLVRHYTSTYPSIGPNSKQLKDLILAIIAKIKDSIENDVFIPMFPKNVYDNKTSGVSLFFHRQFWSAWKLLGSVLMWHRILSDSNIHDLAIRSLLNLYLLPALNLAVEINLNDALDKTKNVICVLPREWCKGENDTHVFLGRLELFLVALAEKLDPAKNAPELQTVCDLLKALGARNQSEKIANKYL